MTSPRRSWHMASVIAMVVGSFIMSAAFASGSSMRSSSASADVNRGKPLKDQLPWMRSSAELSSELQELVKNCNGSDATVSAVGSAVQLEVLRIRGRNAQPGSKAMLVFGEHARELITGETALGLVKALCGKGPSAEHAKHVLRNSEFVIVPNANPLGRKQVEDGYYCKRTNENKVDLNRNWDEKHRDASIQLGDETYPGPTGDIEPETQTLEQLVDDEQPDIFLSVHSGAYMLGMPYGYNSETKPKPDDQTAMMEVLQPISDRFCNGGCPFGNLAEMSDYDLPGCDIDYVYEKLKTPYVFNWEIYAGENVRNLYTNEASRQKRQRDDAKDASGFLQRRVRTHGESLSNPSADMESQKPEDEEGFSSCLDEFNPKTAKETEAVVENWSGAFLELCDEVSKRKSAVVQRQAGELSSYLGF